MEKPKLAIVGKDGRDYHTLEAEPDVTQIETDTRSLQTRASALTIASDAEYADAVEFLKAIRRVVKEVNKTFAEVIKNADTLHSNLIAKRNEHREPLQLAEQAIMERMRLWRVDQDRIRHEAEQAERARLKREADDRRLADAQALQDAGDDAGAEALIEAPPIIAPPVVLPAAVPKAKGIKVRKIPKFRIVDAAAIPWKYMTIDMKKIGGVVRALKENAKIPGVEVYFEDSTAVKV